MTTIVDSELIKKNCLYYCGLHSKSVDVLRKANGKTDYRQIAKILGLHKTKVSGLLKDAQKLGLAEKTGKFYKKKPGILKFMPTSKSKKLKEEKISDVIAKISKKKLQLPASKHEETFGVNFRDRAEKMAKAYLWLYLTENTLRELIRKVFKNEQDWWKNRVNKGIKDSVKEAKDGYPYHAAERKDELEYTHLGQLKEIIASKNNWDMFIPLLNEKDKNSFKATIDKAIPSRNSIAHCTPLTNEDFKFVEVRFRDILNMIKSN
jgi:DNA-binding Lrp family transcriptional regulator